MLCGSVCSAAGVMSFKFSAGALVGASGEAGVLEAVGPSWDVGRGTVLGVGSASGSPAGRVCCPRDGWGCADVDCGVGDETVRVGIGSVGAVEPPRRGWWGIDGALFIELGLRSVVCCRAACSCCLSADCPAEAAVLTSVELAKLAIVLVPPVATPRAACAANRVEVARTFFFKRLGSAFIEFG